MRRLNCVIGVLLAVIRAATSVAGDYDNWNRPQIVPDGAAVSLKLDKPQYFLGENITLQFVVKNNSANQLLFVIGGDTDWSTRPFRFKVTSKDAAGIVVTDPSPNQDSGGGMIGPVIVKPGAEWTYPLSLHRFLNFDQPGKYTIRATHDFGWTEDATHKRPIGETKITFVMPTAEQAETLVTEWSKLPPHVTWAYAKEHNSLPDFSMLRQPIYLPALSKAAEANSPIALAGIASIHTPEATAELIRLITLRQKPDVIAAELLYGRLPNPNVPGSIDLSKQFWDAKWTSAVGQAAKQLLSATDSDSVHSGAQLLDAIGESEDLPDLVAAFGRALKDDRPRHGEGSDSLDPPGRSYQLVTTMNHLVLRGAKVNPQPTTPAELSLYLMTVANDGAFRPAGWQDRCIAAMGHAHYYVRELAARAWSGPLTERVKTSLLPLFADPDDGVQRAACDLAVTLHDPSLKPLILNALRSASDTSLIQSAFAAAVASGAKAEACGICAVRMNQRDQLFDLMQLLSQVVKYPGNGANGNSNITPAEIAALQTHWRAFLTAHREEINSGKLFEIGDPVLIPDLFRPAYQFGLKDGTMWPPN